MSKKRVATINQLGFEVAEENAQRPVAQVGFVEPTAEELSQMTFAKLRELRIHTQELRNRFARLLNRGSSLE